MPAALTSAKPCFIKKAAFAYPLYRDRYQPLLTSRRWSWLNYHDFSLNNWFKFGFNDIRLRDKAFPGLVSALV